MASFNKVILIGNLVADPELKRTPSGVPVTSFRIAVGRRFAKEGDAVQADFFDIVCWRSTAEFVTRYFSKGKPILVCGSLQSRTWVDQNNQKRHIVEVVADEVTFVERKTYDGAMKGDGVYYDGGDAPAAQTAAPQRRDADVRPETNFEEISTEDDLPF